MAKKTQVDAIWHLGEDLKKGTTLENNSYAPLTEKDSFYKKMPEEGRSKGTWGGGVNRP